MRHLGRLYSFVSAAIVVWVVVYSLAFLGEIGLERAGVSTSGWAVHHWAWLAIGATVIWAIVIGGYAMGRRRTNDPAS